MSFIRFNPLIQAFLILLLSGVNSALAIEFRSEVDRDEIAQDESVSMKLVVEADGTVPVEAPEFNAPNFDELQNYQGSFVQSYYDSNSGKFGAKFTRSFTYVLRPKSTGRLSITNIKIKVGGQQYTANPITVVVTGGGGGTPPPQGYGGAGSGLRGAAKKGRGTTLFLRTEVDKTKAYRGQQVVVNYYLYSRARSFNATADRYPNLNGFLKEELDIPVLRGQLTPQEVVLDGTAYRRVLIASFAAYPLKEGKLNIDPMEVKATYIEERRVRPGAMNPFGDEDDLFQQFFQNGAPRTESLRSESISIEVLPLPEIPKDLNYTGAVGDFEVVSAVDRTDLKAHEALSLTLKVEGSGNLSNIETPKISLPEGFELYEAKSQTKGKAGMGEKIFEYLIIPRKSGDFTLPAVQLGFFDPKKNQYVQKSTEAIRIHVNEGDPGAENQAPSKMDPSKEIATPEKGAKRIFGLFSGDQSDVKNSKSAASKFLSSKRNELLGALGLVVLFSLLLSLRNRILSAALSIGAQGRKRKQQEREWARVRRQGEEAQRLPFPEVLSCFGFIERKLDEALSDRFGIAARGLTRAELKETLVEQGKIHENLWQRLSALLEFTETLRFASHAGAVSEERARNELKKWIAECEQVLLGLGQKNRAS